MPDDAVHHPSKSRTGYYTSMDITKMLGIAMDAFQEWIRQGYIRPVTVQEGPTGWIKCFNRSGLCMIAMFKKFLDQPG